MKRSAGCHPDLPHYAKGVCKKCYFRDYHRSKPHPSTRRAPSKPCAGGCGKMVYPRNIRCLQCHGIAQRGSVRVKRKYTDSGYVYHSGYMDHPNADKGGCIMEHVLLMAEHLGRPLDSSENVHHLNGVRDDNRMENLELWCKPQPKGIRTQDAMAWAIVVLSRYAPELLRNETT